MYHPSITQGTVVATARRRRSNTSARRRRGTTSRRRRTSRVRPAARVSVSQSYYPSSSGRRRTRTGVQLPMVRYHPSISRAVTTNSTIPTVRYHPSIKL